MNKFMLSLLLTTAVGASSMSAQPETWEGKLVAAPIQVINRNAYLLNGSIAALPAMMATVSLTLAYANPAGFIATLPYNAEATQAILKVMEATPIIVPAAILIALWAGTTYVGGTLTKSCSKAIMDAFDIPEQQ